MAAESTDWESRCQVLYHYYAYQWFDKSEACLNIVNLTDADVEFFNRTANTIRGLDAQYKLAEYLEMFKVEDINANTHRRRLLSHIHQYNLTQPTRRRFYLLNVKDSDLHFIQIIARTEDGAVSGVSEQALTPILASDVTTGTSGVVSTAHEDDDVAAGAKECLSNRKVKIDAELAALKAKEVGTS